MKRVLSVMCLMVVSACVQAQQPYTVTRLFGSVIPGWDDVYSVDVDGTFNTLTLSFPDFQGFNSIVFDRERDRVLLIVLETGKARIVSVDPSFNPGSVITLREGIDENAIGLNVDPASGRIYWWENDAILSVGSDGTGAAVIEADSVAEPDELVIDAVRGFYVMDSLSDLFIGQLDGVSSPAPIEIPAQITSSASPLALAIEPLTGAVYWSEYIGASGFTGDACAIYRVPYDNPLSTPELVLGSDVRSLAPKRGYLGLAVISDQLVATSTQTLSTDMDPLLTIFNMTTNEVVDVEILSAFRTLSIDYDIAPILIQPVGAVVNQGGSHVFEVGPLDENSTFQWRRNGVPVQENDRVSGATMNKLVINDAMVQDTDTYRCVVTTSLGEQQVSDEVIFAVRGSQDPVCAADLNGDGELNFFDVSVFLSLYNAGCP